MNDPIQKEIICDTYAYKYEKTTWEHIDSFHKHMHTPYELLFFVDGCCDYVIEDRRYSLQPYDLVLIPRNTYHFLEVRGKFDYYERFVVSFLIDALDFPESRIASIFKNGRIFHFEENSAVSQCFFRTLHYIEKFAEEDFVLLSKFLIHELLLNIEAESPTEINSASIVIDSIISNALQYIEKNITKIESIGDVADAMFVSKPYFFSRFKNAMGISPMHYIRNKRVLLAENMIRNGTSAHNAAMQCGFKDYVTFYRAYTSILNRTPSQSK